MSIRCATCAANTTSPLHTLPVAAPCCLTLNTRRDMTRSALTYTSASYETMMCWFLTPGIRTILSQPLRSQTISPCTTT
eukprot:6156204-Ditylum_brightwellii.AAC.1